MTASQDRSLRLWNPTKGVHVKTYSGPHNHEVNDVVVAESNTKFASCGGDKHFFLWDVSTGQVIRKFVGHDRKVNSLAYGPNEEVLISASHDKTVRVWDLRARSRTPIQIMDEAKDSVLCVCVAGDTIITGSVDGGLRQYDVRKGQCVVDELLQPIGSVSVSNDGQCILVSTLNNTIRLLERDNGTELACYKGHQNQRFKVRSVLDPSDAYVVSGSEDDKICFWDLVEAQLCTSLTKQGGPIFCLGFYENVMVSAGATGRIQVHKIH